MSMKDVYQQADELQNTNIVARNLMAAMTGLCLIGIVLGLIFGNDDLVGICVMLGLFYGVMTIANQRLVNRMRRRGIYGKRGQ